MAQYPTRGSEPWDIPLLEYFNTVIEQVTAGLATAGFVVKGAWSASPGTYAALSLVTNSGGVYISNAATVAGDVPGASAKWTALPLGVDATARALANLLSSSIPAAVATGGAPLLTTLPPESGMQWVIADKTGLIGRRSDGVLIGMADTVARLSTVRLDQAFPAATSIPATPLLVSMPPESGMSWAISAPDGSVLGRRTDGKSVGFGSTTSTDAVRSPVVKQGDSLSANWTNDAGFNRVTLNAGIGSQTSEQIAARVGALPGGITFPSNTIPVTTDPVAVTVSVQLLTRIGAAATRTAVVNVCGVPGVLTGTDPAPSGVYTFTRSTAGAAVYCPPGSPIQTGFDLRDAVPIIGVGRNDMAIWSTPALGITRIRKMLEWSRRGREGVVLSIPPMSNEVNGSADRIALDAVNAAVAAEFGALWFDWAAVLRSPAALASAGLPVTTQDTADIANGVTPVSFRTDAVHFNPAAYGVINPFIESILTARGL